MVLQPPNRAINLIIIILLFCGLVSTVSADSTNPPAGITICGYVTYANEIGIWWFNPYDPDFSGVEMWLDDVYLGNTTSSDHFYNAYSAIVGTHTFSTHTFDNSGNVNTTWVNLTFITKEYPGCTENWTCDTCSRPVIPGAIANFTQNTTEGLTPLEVQFTDTSTGSPTFWNWSFGDGTYSDIQDVTKTYTSGGYYEINLTVWNANATRSSKLGYVDVWNRTSNVFDANQTFGNVTFAVLFADTSYNATSWFWIFDGFNTSTEKSPTFNYTVPGIYSVNHSSSNDRDIFWTNKTDYITAYPPLATIPPTANFTGTPTSGVAPLTVQFTDMSTGSPTSWNWSFGDGNFSNLQSPPHIYTYPGVFTVSLNVTNSAGSNTLSLTDYITLSVTPTITPTQPTITPTQPTITPTQPTTIPTPPYEGGGGGDGGDTCRFNPSTGGASESGGKAGETLSIPFPGNREASECVPVVVVDISIVPAVDIPGIMVSAEKANIGPTTEIPGNPKAYYLDINWYWVRDAEVKDVYITFSVDEQWMKDRGITPENLVMLRYYDNSWHEIPTQREEYSSGRYYYVASASGVSYFAVTNKGALGPSTIQTPASQITIPQQTLPESQTIEPTRFANLTTVPKTPVKTTTTVPPISSEEPYEIPIIWIIIGIGAFIGLVLVALLVRRWWIRRQNPALFRKYD
jgi:PGF-pre-PGF domain-containing protein